MPKRAATSRVKDERALRSSFRYLLCASVGLLALTIAGVVLQATSVVVIGLVGLAAGAYGLVDTRRKLDVARRNRPP